MGDSLKVLIVPRCVPKITPITCQVRLMFLTVPATPLPVVAHFRTDISIGALLPSAASTLHGSTANFHSDSMIQTAETISNLIWSTATDSYPQTILTRLLPVKQKWVQVVTLSVRRVSL